MHFLKMKLLKGNLMGITFDVGRVTAYALYIQRNYRKLHIVRRFNEYFDNFFLAILSADGNSLTLFY